jgi:hypothetical protein
MYSVTQTWEKNKRWYLNRLIPPIVMSVKIDVIADIEESNLPSIFLSYYSTAAALLLPTLSPLHYQSI